MCAYLSNYLLPSAHLARMPAKFTSLANKQRQLTAEGSTVVVDDLKIAHNKKKLELLASRMLADDTFTLLEAAHVSAAKQARALRARQGLQGAREHIDDVDASGLGMSDLGFRLGGVALTSGGGFAIQDASSSLRRGAKLKVVPIFSRSAPVSSALFRSPGLSDDESDGGGGPSTRARGGRDATGDSEDARSSSAAMPMRSPNRIQLAPLGMPSRKPKLDISSDQISSALIDWRAPTRLYVWGSGASGQLGAGSDPKNGKAVVQRCLNPMRVHIGGDPAADDGGDAKTSSTSNPDSIHRGIVEVTPIRVAVGRSVTAVIDNKRRVWTTGDGWLGRGGLERAHIPQPVTGLGGPVSVVEVACGHGFFVCCTMEGHVFVWGENLSMAHLNITSRKDFRRDGLGLGGSRAADKDANPSAPASPGASRAPAAFLAAGKQPLSSPSGAAGGAESAAVPRGATAHGHPLGLAPGDHERVPMPRQVIGGGLGGHGEHICSVAAGEGHMVALSTTGRVFTWGAGTSGACGHGSLDHCWSPTAIKLRPRRGNGLGSNDPYGSHNTTRNSSFSSSIHGSPGSGYGSDGDNESVSGSTIGGASAVASVVTRGTGTLNRSSFLSPRSFLQAARRQRIAGAATEGGDDEGDAGAAALSGTAAEEGRLVCAIAAGAHHTAVLACDGGVHVFGFAADGRLGLGIDKPIAVSRPTQLRGLPTMVGLACGGAHTLLLSADGRVYACGDNTFGQCGVNSRIYAQSHAAETLMSLSSSSSVVPPRLHADSLGVHEDVPAEAKVLVPRQVFTPSFSNVLLSKVIAGDRHSAAISLDGQLWMWGLNAEGACGNGSDTTSPEPVRVNRFKELRVVQAALGTIHSAAIVSRSKANNSTRPIDNFDGGDDAATGGGGGAAEPQLPIKLRRVRRQQLSVRMKAIAYAAAIRRRRARAARRRALRKAAADKMASSHGGTQRYSRAIEATQAAQTSDAARGGLGSSDGDVTDADADATGRGRSTRIGAQSYQVAVPKPIPHAAAVAAAGTHRHHHHHHHGRRRTWEEERDDAEFGKHAAAHYIQTMMRRWLWRVKRASATWRARAAGLQQTAAFANGNTSARSLGLGAGGVAGSSSSMTSTGATPRLNHQESARRAQLTQLHALGFKAPQPHGTR